MASEVKAQDKKDLFNPVNYAVISQTIAPDARGGGLLFAAKNGSADAERMEIASLSPDTLNIGALSTDCGLESISFNRHITA